MEESGPHKHSILRNKEVPKKNAPHKPHDVTRPTVMVKRYGFRGTLPIKYKIDFWNNPITASVLVWNQVVLNQSQQLGYLNSKLMLSWDCPFKGAPSGDFLCVAILRVGTKFTRCLREGGRFFPPQVNIILTTIKCLNLLSLWMCAALFAQWFTMSVRLCAFYPVLDPNF